ncbi:hypothetical protein [Anaerosphaera multitolerans]|nr:hypothetical protein [Anaerosphaera multitolerans]
MNNLKVSQAQLKYLLYIKDSKKFQTITSLSRYFNCSKSNSKKIVDRLIAIGLIYKFKNDIIFTQIGERFIDEFVSCRDRLIIVLSSGMSLDHEKAKKIADTILINKIEELNLKFLETYEKLEIFKDSIEKTFSYKILEDKLGEGEYNVNLVILKKDEVDNSSIVTSTAMECCSSTAKLIIAKSSTINIKVKPVVKTLNDIVEKGFLRSINYEVDNKNYNNIISESKCILPLNILNNWFYSGSGILQAAVIVEMLVNVNFYKNHIEKVVMLFTLDLFKI